MARLRTFGGARGLRPKCIFPVDFRLTPPRGACITLLPNGTDAGWSSQVARRAHNPEATGSNPVPATKSAVFRDGAFLLADRDATIFGPVTERDAEHANTPACTLECVPTGRKVELRLGQSLLAGVSKARLPLARACGGRGVCDSCRVLVLRGEGALEAPTPEERDLLARGTSDPRWRLACLARTARVGDRNMDVTHDASPLQIWSPTWGALDGTPHRDALCIQSADPHDEANDGGSADPSLGPGAKGR